MNKVLLLAYTNINFGDDMFIKTICKCFPNVNFVLEAPAIYKKIFSNTPNLKIKNNNIIVRILNKIGKQVGLSIQVGSNDIGKYRAVVYVVGGLFDEDEGWNANISKFGLQEVKKNLWKNSYNNKVPFLLLGCNMTTVDSKEYIEQMEYMFDGLADICFRDIYSYGFFKNLSNTRYAPDIVFNYNCENKTKKDNLVIISVWGVLTKTEQFPSWKWATDWWQDYRDFIVNVVNMFADMGKKVVLLSLCENEGDVQASDMVKRCLVPDTGVESLNYNGNLDEVIALFEKADFVVGTRFHSIVMAMNAGCKFFPIIYESKTEQLLKDLGYVGPKVHVKDVKGYDLKNVSSVFERENVIDIKKYKEYAQGQFEVLEKILFNNE